MQGVIDLGPDVDLETVAFEPSDLTNALPFTVDGLADVTLKHDTIILESRTDKFCSPLRLKDVSICREMVVSIPGLDRRNHFNFAQVNSAREASTTPSELCKVTLICSNEHHNPEDYNTSFDRQVSLVTDGNAKITGLIRSEVADAHMGFASRWWIDPVEQPLPAVSSGILEVPPGEQEKTSRLKLMSEQPLSGRSQRSISIKLDSALLDDRDRNQWRTMDWDPTRYKVLIDGLDSDITLNIVKKNRDPSQRQKVAEVAESAEGVTGSLTYFVPDNLDDD